MAGEDRGDAAVGDRVVHRVGEGPPGEVGLGGPVDTAAAEWSRRSTAAGDPIGQFNHGVDLLRGHGVPQDEAAGRRLVGEAVRPGVDSAKRLQAAGYDVGEITPDADDWRYQPQF